MMYGMGKTHQAAIGHSLRARVAHVLHPESTMQSPVSGVKIYTATRDIDYAKSIEALRSQTMMLKKNNRASNRASNRVSNRFSTRFLSTAGLVVIDGVLRVKL
jgi:hypothetical protein